MKTRYAIFTMLTVLLLAGLFSCSNFFSVKDGVYTDAKTKITLSGTLTADGALPHEVFKPETKTAGRSAVPLFDESNLTFEITAKKTRDSSVVAGTISDDHSSFTIPDLELTEEYVITVQAKKGNTVVLEDSEPITLTRENNNSLHMTLLPKADGKGSVNLDISTGDCEVSKIVWSFDDGEPVTVTDASSTTISIPEVEAGSHLLCLKFYSLITDGSKSQEVWIASCYENVNVLSGLVTDTWIRSAGMTDLHLIPAGRPDGMDIQEFLLSVMDENTRSIPAGPATFELYSFFLNRLSDSPLFVSASGNDTTGTGSPFNPYRTLTKAINQALTIPAEHFVTIMVEPGLSDRLTEDLIIADTDIDIEVYNLSENQSYQTEYTIDTNGHNITISGESRLNLDQAAITNTSGTSSTIFLETEDPHDNEHWGSSVHFRGCTLDNLSIVNYGTVFFGDEYEDFADTVLTDTKIFMKGNSRIYIDDEHEQNSLYVDISEHDADTWTYLPVQTAGQYCNFIYNEYQTDVVESFFHEYPHDAIYVNPDVYDSKETGTVRNPYKTFAKAIENARDSDTIALPRGLTISDDSASVTIDKSLTIDAYGEGDARAIIDSTQLNLLLADGDKVYINNIEFINKANKTYDSGSFIAAKYHLDESFTPFNGTVSCTNCTFTGGKTENYGVISASCTLNLEKCVFSDNEGDNGSAIYTWKGNINAEACTFTNNTASLSVGALSAFDSSVCLKNCTFTRNTGGSYGSGAVSIGSFENENATLTAEGCTFEANSSNQTGGAVSAETAFFTDCKFIGNIAHCGGAADIGYGEFTRCTFTGNKTSEDYEYGEAGAISGSIAIFDECTFKENVSNYFGAFSLGGLISLKDCTFSGNRTTDGTPKAGFIGGDLILQGNNIFKDTESIQIQSNYTENPFFFAVEKGTTLKDSNNQSIKIPLYWDPVYSDYEGINIFSLPDDYEDDTYYSQTETAKFFTVDDSVSGYILSPNGIIINAASSILYVGSNGKDEDGYGLSQSAPYKTIWYALEQLNGDGDYNPDIEEKIIYVESGLSEEIYGGDLNNIHASVIVYTDSTDNETGTATMTLTGSGDITLWRFNDITFKGIEFTRKAGSCCTTNSSGLVFIQNHGVEDGNETKSVVTFENCSFSGGRTTSDGGAICNQSTVTLKNCSFTNNYDCIPDSSSPNAGGTPNSIYATPDAETYLAGTISSDAPIDLSYSAKITIDEDISVPDGGYIFFKREDYSSGDQVLKGDKVASSYQLFRAENQEYSIKEDGCLIHSPVSGTITIPELYDDSISISCYTEDNVIHFQNLNDVTVSYYEIWYHGSDLKTTETWYPQYDNTANTLDMSSLPYPGLYKVVLWFTYNGTPYSASFDYTKE